VPSGVAAGDIVILVCTIDASAAAFDAGDYPTGFTELGEVDLTGDGQSVAVGWKRLSAADAGTYQFGALGTGGTGTWVTQAYAFRDRSTVSAPTISTIATDNNNNTSPVSVTANGVTAFVGDDLLMISAPDVRGDGIGNGHTAPSNFDEREDAENGFSNLAGFTREDIAAGSTGNITATFSHTGGATGSGWAAILVRIPAPIRVSTLFIMGMG
jgi:hypothetical protein